MLDDLKMIHQRDARDALGAAGKQGRQLGHSFELLRFGLPSSYDVRHIHNVVFAGEGDMALGAELIGTWPTAGRPFVITQGQDLPSYMGTDTLFIAASLSGNETEVLEALAQAEAKGAQIVIIAQDGGALAGIARTMQYPMLTLPAVDGALSAYWYTFKAVLVVLESYGLIEGKIEELSAQIEWFTDQLRQWQPDMPVKSNPAKQIALELIGKSVVVYSGPRLNPVAYHWKAAINQYAKQVAWCGKYPNANYDDLAGWSKQPVHKPYSIVELRSSLEQMRIQKSYELAERLLSGLRPAPVIVEPAGGTLLRQLLYTAALGDFVSIYLALLGNVDPYSSKITDKFKKELP
jgi:glucose/mannose-6-phosphate isomerase